MHSRITVLVSSFVLLSAVIIPACSKGEDPTSPTGCATLDTSPSSLQNNENGRIIIKGQFSNEASVYLTLSKDGVTAGNGLLKTGHKVPGSDDFYQFDNLPAGTWDASWLVSCDPDVSPTEINGPSTVTVH